MIGWLYILLSYTYTFYIDSNKRNALRWVHVARGLIFPDIKYGIINVEVDAISKQSFRVCVLWRDGVPNHTLNSRYGITV